jgi:HEAT repeat protein
MSINYAELRMASRARTARHALVLVIAFAGCAHYDYIGTTATSFLKVIRDDKDPNRRHFAYAKLASLNCYDTEEQKSQAVRVLSVVLTKGHEPDASRAVICRTLGQLGRPEGREAVIGAAEDEKPLVRAEACRAVGRLGKPDDVTILSRHMTADTSLDCRIAAIEGIGHMKPTDPNVETLLVDGMEDSEPGIRMASYRALQAITGKDFGPEPEAWRKDAIARSEKAAKTMKR